LSGETGAGKSIIINAVNLLLGARANSKLIRTGAETAELEAMFDISSGGRAAKIMEEQGYDPADGLIIRRIISHAERHKVYVNGRMSTMQALNEITENMASISGQHAHQGLLKEELHLEILDQFAGLIQKREKVRSYFHSMTPLIAKLKKLQSMENSRSEHTELLMFQKREILEASLTPGEDDELEGELSKLKNAELILKTVDNAYENLYGMPGAVVETVVELCKSMEKVSVIDPSLQPNLKGLHDAAYQIEDISHELKSYLDSVEMDERRMEEIGSRLELVRKLKRKYGKTIEKVLERLEAIETELSSFENMAESIAAVERNLEDLSQKLFTEAVLLSGKRKKAAVGLADIVESELADLKMSGTRFAVEITPIPVDSASSPFLRSDKTAVCESGIDQAVFMISPNVGEDLKPLASIASGGELSRVVLVLKAILAQNDSAETIVFDEVDAGIGGDVAEMVGKKLHALSKRRQIVCITHLPQIARFGDHHFRISKQVRDQRTRTTIEPVKKEDRIRELARMLGGVEITKSAMDHAAEMLNSPKQDSGG
jgi:DNA repair protein RecN (Recombination protein N)